MSHAPKTIIEYEIFDSKEASRNTIKGSTYQMNGRLQIMILDKEGKQRLLHTQPFGSYVSNFGKILNFALTGATNVGLKNTAGTASARNITKAAVSSAANENTVGIFIGDIRNSSGFNTFAQEPGISTTIQLNDFQLYRKIPASNSGVAPTPSDMLYDGTAITAPSAGVLKVTATFTCSRSTGIRVSEVGLIGKDPYNGAKFNLLARDIVTNGAESNVFVENGETLQIDYIFTITDSSGFTTNYLKMVQSLLSPPKASAGAVTPKTMGGSTSGVYFASASNASNNCRVIAPADNATYGILLGGTTNDVPRDDIPMPVITDYKLNSQFTNNAVLDHGLVTAISLTAENGETKFGIYRDFKNVGTNNLYLREVGLVCKHKETNYHYLLNRARIAGNKWIVLEPSKTIRVKIYYVYEIGDILNLGANPTYVKPTS